MQRNAVVLSFIVVWTVLTIAAVLWGFKYNLPDFVHVDYGLPLNWARNTLSTFVGSVNQWEVTISNLLIDLLFWLGLMIAAVAVMLYKLK